MCEAHRVLSLRRELAGTGDTKIRCLILNLVFFVDGIRKTLRSRDSSVCNALGYELDGQNSILGRGRAFLSTISVLTGAGAHPDTIEWVPGAISLEVKRPRREADHSLLFSAEIKNGGTIPPLPHMFS
jgi:hypothetical protein